LSHCVRRGDIVIFIYQDWGLIAKDLFCTLEK